jgi:hypothetical protein
VVVEEISKATAETIQNHLLIFARNPWVMRSSSSRVALDLIELALFEITQMLSTVYPLDESMRSKDGELSHAPFPTLLNKGTPNNGQ